MMESVEHSSANSPNTAWIKMACNEELLHAAKAGSHTAFAELRNIYASRLYRRTLSITRNHEDAEDALQDTFVRAYRSLPSFEGRSSLSTWLTSIAINSALMIIRKRRSRAEISLEQSLEDGGDSVPFEAQDDSMNPEQFCDQNQRCEKIRYAIQRLDPTLRIPLLTRISKETSLTEIAHELDISLASAKSRLYRARKRLTRSHL